MKISEVPFALLRLHYQLARIPLQLIEDRVVTRIATEAPARLFYERSLGMLDTTVGNVLGDSELVERGAALVERSDALGRAAELDAEAAARQEQAGSKLRKARHEAIEERQEAQAATEQEIKEARATADKRKRAATESAQKRSASAKERRQGRRRAQGRGQIGQAPGSGDNAVRRKGRVRGRQVRTRRRRGQIG